MLTSQKEYSVGELAALIKGNLEETFGFVRLRGEVSGAKLHTSGHLYFRLKDADAVIDAVAWRHQAQRLSFTLSDGMDVICTGRITTYPGASRYQIIAEHIEQAGEGALLKLLEERKRKLAAEGLFAEHRKKPLPFLPSLIGVITSPTGAVIRDILHRIQDRFPSPIWLWPVAVQGETAATQIEAALRGFETFYQRGTRVPDVLILARGGGSLEDLWPFNEEKVVRAIADCSIPLISAIGHETDFSLADFAADCRAPTPTAAAEMAVPVKRELALTLQKLALRQTSAFQNWCKTHHRNFSLTASRLTLITRLLDDKSLLLLHRSDRLGTALQQAHTHYCHLLDKLAVGISHPQQLILLKEYELSALSQRLRLAFESVYIATPQQSLLLQSKILEALSYRQVLSRGFSYITTSHGTAVTSAEQAREQEWIKIHFNDGSLAAKVRQTRQDKNPTEPQHSLFDD